MKENRVKRVLDNMAEMGLEQMVVTDPYSIFYLTGKMIKPGERLLALYLNTNGDHKIFINKLFTAEEDLEIEKIRFTDTDDYLHLLSKYTDHSKKLGIDKNMRAVFLLPLMEDEAAAGFVNASVCVDKARALKDEEECELMREASRVNDEVMGELVKRIHAGITEEELAKDLKDIYKSYGAQGFSFEPSVSFGKMAAVGHHRPADVTLQDGDCILLDIGCVKDGYCSDMTRTVFFKEATAHQKEIYNLVRKANETAEKMIKPGVRFCDIDKAARDVIAEAGYGEYFTHRLGHSIGLEDHEQGDVSAVNTDSVKPGMTFSVEPGVYLPEDIGVRVEDLVLVTEDGCEILNHYSKEFVVVE